MSKLSNALRVHELVDASKTGSSLTTKHIAQQLDLSPKQVTGCFDLLRGLELPLEYSEKEHRWFYAWDNRFYSRALADRLSPRLKNFPDQGFGVLLMLRHGLEQLKGTQMFSSVQDFLRTIQEDAFAVLQSQLEEIISYRRHPVEPVDDASFAQVAAAVYERRQIQFYYQKIGALDEMLRTVNPHHMTCVEGVWYLLAWDLTREAMRTFALTRIREVWSTGESFERLPPGTIQRQLENAFCIMGQGENRVARVRLRFAAKIAILIRERRWHPSQEITPLADGGLELEMDVASLSEIEKWVLSWGENVQVLEPPELIATLTKRIEAMRVLYYAPK